MALYHRLLASEAYGSRGGRREAVVAYVKAEAVIWREVQAG